LLNVFLAIAVDNLANAQDLTRLEEEADREREQIKKRRLEKRRNGWAKAKQLPMIMAITKINNHNSNNPFPNAEHHSPRSVYILRMLIHLYKKRLSERKNIGFPKVKMGQYYKYIKVQFRPSQ
jgi:hypothetical protein